MNNSPNMHTGTVKLNHGGHEMFDVHELLSGTINILDHYTMYRPQIKCQELLQILDNQYQFITDEYNMILQAFSTGQDPQHGTRRYQMSQSNESIVYGMQQSSPKKPVQSPTEIKEANISGAMQGFHKAMAGAKAVAACEITNPVVRRVVADSIPNCVEMAYELFLYQNKRHYYQVPQLAEQDMKMMQNAFAPATGQTQTMGMGQPQMASSMQNQVQSPMH